MRTNNGASYGQPLIPRTCPTFYGGLGKRALLENFRPLCHFYRYIDDYILLVLRRMNLQIILVKNNAVDPAIQLTLEED